MWKKKSILQSSYILMYRKLKVIELNFFSYYGQQMGARIFILLCFLCVLGNICIL